MNKIYCKTILLLFISLFILNFNSSANDQKSKIESLLIQRDKASRELIDAQLAIDGPISRSVFDSIMNMANDLKSKDEILLSEYKILIDTLNEKASYSDDYQEKNEKIKADFFKTETYLKYAFAGGALFFLLFIVFLLLFITSLSKRKKAQKDVVYYKHKETERDALIKNYEADVENQKSECDFKIQEVKAYYEKEIAQLKENEAQLFRLRQHAESEMNSAKKKEIQMAEQFDQYKLEATEIIEKLQNDIEKHQNDTIIAVEGDAKDKQIEELEKELKELSTQKSYMDIELKNMKSRLAIKEDHEAKNLEQIALLNQKIQDLSANQNLSIIEKSFKSADEDLSIEKEREYKQKEEQLMKHMSILEDELNDVREQLRRELSENQDLKYKLNNKSNLYNEASIDPAEHESLKQRVADLYDELEKAKSELLNEITVNQNLKAELMDKKEEPSVVDNSMANDFEVESLKKQILFLKEDLNSLNEKLLEETSRNAALDLEMNRLRTEEQNNEDNSNREVTEDFSVQLENLKTELQNATEELNKEKATRLLYETELRTFIKELKGEK